MSHQTWFDPIPPYSKNVPLAMREWHDYERPEWLDLTVAQFLKSGLRELEATISKRRIPGVDWSNPWIKLQIPLPWRRKPVSEALAEDVQLMLREPTQEQLGELGGFFANLNRIRAIEYLTRYAGTVVIQAERETPELSALILDRVLEQDYLMALAKRQKDCDSFVERLLAPFSIGLDDEPPVKPLLRNERARLHAKELNRIRDALRDSMRAPGASMALVFQPTVVYPERAASVSSFWFGLNLSAFKRKHAEANGGEKIFGGLHRKVDKLLDWASEIPSAHLVRRTRSIKTEDRGESTSLPIPDDMAPGLREALGIESIERKLDHLSQALERGGSSPLQTSAIASRGRPGRHDVGKAEYRKFLESRERDLRFNRMFRVFREEWPWAQSQPSAELDLLRQTIERNKLHKKYWNEIADIRKQKASRKSSRKRSRGKR